MYLHVFFNEWFDAMMLMHLEYMFDYEQILLSGVNQLWKAFWFTWFFHSDEFLRGTSKSNFLRTLIVWNVIVKNNWNVVKKVQKHGY